MPVVRGPVPNYQLTIRYHEVNISAIVYCPGVGNSLRVHPAVADFRDLLALVTLIKPLILATDG